MPTFTAAAGVADRAAVIAELEDRGLFVVEWTDGAGVSYPEHSHATSELRHVLEGSMTIVVDGRSYELRPGDRIELEPGEAHSAEVGPDGVRYLAATPDHPV